MARTTRRQAAAAPPAPPISDYARVSKSQGRLPAAAVKKAAAAAAATTKEPVAKAATVTTRKRKAAAIEEDKEKEEEEEEEEEKKKKGEEKEEAVVDNGKKDMEDKDDQEDEENRPSRAQRIVASKPSSSHDEPHTPAKRARRTEPTEPVKTPQTKAKPTPKPTPGPAPRKAAKTTTKTPSKEAPTPGKGSRQSKLEDFRYTSRKADNGADLIRLHRAFLKTVLLHVAHHGRTAPIDIAAIAPNIARNWGKRQVAVDDIRRCVALEAETSARDPARASPFVVCDYGRGRVCVELKQEWVRDSVAPIGEARLCEQFEANIRRICAERARDSANGDVGPRLEDVALADLPRADVVDRRDGSTANPLLAKGHRALSELKNELVEKQQAKDARKQHAPAKPEPEHAQDAAGPRMSLLDRIRLKQLAKANEPLPPSAAELRRRAALNRVADVAATVSMLSLANTAAPPRQAFTMTLVSDKLRDSLRVPISRDEGVACIRLIAEEVAPEWIKVVAVGGRENVVIQRDNQPVDRILQDRVQKLLG